MSQCERCGHDPGFPVAVCASCGFGGRDQTSHARGASPGDATVLRSPSAGRRLNPDATIIERNASGRAAANATAFLLVRAGPDTGLQIAVGDVTTIGRDGDNNLSLRDTRVSGKHAIIRNGPKGYVFQDLLGTNGTFFVGPAGERRLSAPHRLGDGDRLRMGHTVIQFIMSEPGR